MTNTIPLLDLGDADFDVRFLQACRTVGFVAIEGHEIEPELVAAMRAMQRELFGLSDQRKNELRITPTNYRGFIPLGFFTPNRSEVNGNMPDLYEGFKLHWECPPNQPERSDCMLYGANRWVTEVPGMAATVLEYWSRCDSLADQLLFPLADHLGVDRAHLQSWFEAPLTNMTLLHYPPQDPGAETSGIHAHKDTNVLTFLHPDPVGGLQIRDRDGSWIEAAPPDTAILVNIGEMLELWSGGEFVATPHRVVNRSGAHRYSFPWFLVPRHDVIVEPLGRCQPDYVPTAMPVGELSAEVWRTNWANQDPDSTFDLGSLDR